MRVRMLKTHESPASHPEHGPLTLVFGAGTTQHFDAAAAQSLIDNKTKGKPDPIAEALPEESQRVRMARTMTEAEIIDRVNAARRARGVMVESAPGSAFRFPKGELVHFPNETAQVLIDAVDEHGGLFATAEPDPDNDPIAATHASAIENAIARKAEQLAADERRSKLKEQTAAAAAKVKAKAPVAPAPSTPAPAAAPSASTASSTSSEG